MNELKTDGIEIGAGTATVNGASIPALLPSTDEKAALAGTGTPSGTDPFVNDSDGRIPTTDEKAALAGTGTPSAADPYVSDSDGRIPTTDEKAALVGTGTPSAADPYVSDSDGRIPTTDEKAALVGTGTPSAADPYVSDSDARMTDARPPTSLDGMPYSIREIVQSLLAAPFSSAGSAAWQTVHTFNVANVLNEGLLVVATLDVHSLAGIAGMASFRILIGGAGGAASQQFDVDMLGVGVADRKSVTVVFFLAALAADAARAVSLQILDTAGLTYTVDHASVIVVRHQG